MPVADGSFRQFHLEWLEFRAFFARFRSLGGMGRCLESRGRLTEGVEPCDDYRRSAFLIGEQAFLIGPHVGQQILAAPASRTELLPWKSG